MAGIYIHIPFCKQACHYCDFHFSTTLKRKGELVEALGKELFLRKEEITEPIETIYFGGGTPSLLTMEELRFLIDEVYNNFEVIKNPEITLEANPDDLFMNKSRALSGAEVQSDEVFIALKKIGINRLSIGVQSFFEKDLQLMNRAHNSVEAKQCIEEAIKYFDNITIDLIYGIPGMSNQQWRENLKIALGFGIPHISSYALTVEPKTALEKFIKTGKIPPVEESVSHNHYLILLEEMEEAGFVNYEFSNFGKEGYFSKNNTAYWQGKPYLGIGPSAHSFNGKERSWNISNNIKYIKSLSENSLPIERETLSVTDRYNEYIMTGLRTMWGVSLEKVEQDFGKKYLDYLLMQIKKPISEGILQLENKTLSITKKGKFLSDGIASNLFYV